jgi:hypothetical protein
MHYVRQLNECWQQGDGGEQPVYGKYADLGGQVETVSRTTPLNSTGFPCYDAYIRSMHSP